MRAKIFGSLAWNAMSRVIAPWGGTGAGSGTRRTVSSDGSLPSGWTKRAALRRSVPSAVFIDATSIQPQSPGFLPASSPRSCPPDSRMNVVRLFLNAFR